MPLYPHQSAFGVGPKVDEMAFLKSMRCLLAFTTLLSICLLNLSLVSRVRPRNLTDSEYGISTPDITSFLGSLNLFFLWKNIAFVFFGLNFRSSSVQNFVVTLIACCIKLTSVSWQGPVMSIQPSSQNAFAVTAPICKESHLSK